MNTNYCRTIIVVHFDESILFVQYIRRKFMRVVKNDSIR